MHDFTYATNSLMDFDIEENWYDSGGVKGESYISMVMLKI